MSKSSTKTRSDDSDDVPEVLGTCFTGISEEKKQVVGTLDLSMDNYGQ